MTPRETLLAEAATRILITDGAWGTQIQGYGLAEADYAGELGLAREQKGNNDILALTRPDVVEAIARSYFAAGSDIISTNTLLTRKYLLSTTQTKTNKRILNKIIAPR